MAAKRRRKPSSKRMNISPFEILGISSTEDDDSVIKQAFKKLCQQWHPDKCTDESKQEEFASMFRSITEAYDKIKDAESRKNYCDNPLLSSAKIVALQLFAEAVDKAEENMLLRNYDTFAWIRKAISEKNDKLVTTIKQTVNQSKYFKQVEKRIKRNSVTRLVSNDIFVDFIRMNRRRNISDIKAMRDSLEVNFLALDLLDGYYTEDAINPFSKVDPTLPRLSPTQRRKLLIESDDDNWDVDDDD